MLVHRFGGEDTSVLSSVIFLSDLQLNPPTQSSPPTRLLVEPLALRLATSQKALKNAITGSSSPSSRQTPWQAPIAFFCLGGVDFQKLVFCVCFKAPDV